MLFKVSVGHWIACHGQRREASQKTDLLSYLPREVMIASATFFGASL